MKNHYSALEVLEETAPTKENAPATDRGENEEYSPDSASADAQRKRLATLAARFALAGHQLHCRQNGKLVVSRWGWSREFDSISDAETFVEQIGGHDA